MLEGYENLIDFILEKLNAKKMNYVFVDEIQLIPEFQRTADSLFIQKNVDFDYLIYNSRNFIGIIAIVTKCAVTLNLQ